MEFSIPLESLFLRSEQLTYYVLITLNPSGFKVEPHSKYWYFYIEVYFHYGASQKTLCYFTLNGCAIWSFAKFLIGLHGVFNPFRIPLFKIWTAHILCIDNFKSIWVQGWTPLKILIFLHWSLLSLRRFSENAMLFHIEWLCRKTMWNVIRPPYPRRGDSEFDLHRLQILKFWECLLYEIWEYAFKPHLFIQQTVREALESATWRTHHMLVAFMGLLLYKYVTVHVTAGELTFNFSLALIPYKFPQSLTPETSKHTNSARTQYFFP